MTRTLFIYLFCCVMFLNGKESEDRDSTLLASFVSIDIKLTIRVRSELEAMELHD